MRRLFPAAAAVAVAITGCSGPRAGTSFINALGGCAATIPTARAAVHGRGTLVVVQRLNQTQADRVAREVNRLSGVALGGGAAPASPGPTHGRAAATPTVRPSGGPRIARTPRPARSGKPANPRDCLIVWRGPYPAGAVVPSEGRQAGTYALVFVSVRHPKVRLVLLTQRLPKQVHG